MRPGIHIGVTATSLVCALLAEPGHAQQSTNYADAWRTMDQADRFAYITGFSHGVLAAKTLVLGRTSLTERQVDRALGFLNLKASDLQPVSELIDRVYQDPANARVHLYAAIQYAAMVLSGAPKPDTDRVLEHARRVFSQPDRP